MATDFPVLVEGEHPPAGSEAAVVVDRLLRPAVLLTQGRESRLPMTALVHDQPADVAQRALTRPSAERFDPICCIDELGRLVGLIPFEHLVRHLARSERTLP
jgi:hypothetical protein